MKTRLAAGQHSAGWPESVDGEGNVMGKAAFPKCRDQLPLMALAQAAKGANAPTQHSGHPKERITSWLLLPCLVF